MAWKFKKPVDENKQETEQVIIEKPEIKQETKKVTPKEDKHRVVVVKELPMKPIREYKDEDGTMIHFITTEEALTELMNQD